MRPSILVTIAALAATASAGPLGYAACQSGCVPLVMACYAAGGATWGATLGITAPAKIVACNLAWGTCRVCSLGSVMNDGKAHILIGGLRCYQSFRRRNLAGTMLEM